jgi:hypothetical protein
MGPRAHAADRASSRCEECGLLSPVGLCIVEIRLDQVDLLRRAALFVAWPSLA